MVYVMEITGRLDMISARDIIEMVEVIGVVEMIYI